MYSNDFNNNGFNTDFLVAGQLEKQNNLKRQELKEKEAMRKAYCIANNVPYEEIEYNESPKFGQGTLKVLVCLIWLFIVGTLLSSFIGEGNWITNMLGWWF